MKERFKMDNLLSFLKDVLMLKYLPELGTNASFGLILLFGILASIHCIGMCGGIAMSQCVRPASASGKSPEQDAKPDKWFIPSTLYNFGRTVSYTIVGAVAGGLGHIISLQGFFKGIVPIIGGVFMIIMAINLLGIFPALRKFNLRLPGFFARRIINGGSNSPVYVGLLTGLMPCGPLQIMQLYALGTGSVFYGAASMLTFAVGTVPALFLFGAASTLINKKHTAWVLKASAALVLVLGVVMIGRGLALSGAPIGMHTASITSGPASASPASVSVEEGFQTVTTSIEPGSFPPITVKKGIPVKWTIKAEEKNLNKCNNTIVIPEFRIEKELTPGDNLIEFTPVEEGEFIYTCWMGMIKSKITVVGS